MRDIDKFLTFDKETNEQVNVGLLWAISECKKEIQIVKESLTHRWCEDTEDYLRYLNIELMKLENKHGGCIS